MGVIQHNALIVVGEYDGISAIRQKCLKYNRVLRASGEPEVPVTKIARGSNEYCSIAIMPSGSKQGWPRYNNASDLIESIEDHVFEHPGAFLTCARVSFGEVGHFLDVITVGGDRVSLKE